ncbi:MAG: tRNA dihydrouridine(20/20a) synthase DusA [Ahniella sp.]|nr:tRNA dihydrouridine(20/20a) synthase DusA [Ahniella sp.]
MMDWTTTQCRVLHRALSPSARLYTEMVHANAVVFGNRARLLEFDPSEHPIALQLGGSEPVKLAEATRIAVAEGFDEVNLNCGCPSDRVQSGRFGACLMLEPELVAECVQAMIEAADGAVPVTVKCRIGVDDQDDDADLDRFVNVVSAAGCKVFIVHARKAWLKGLSPRENREIPPLNYPRAFRLKRERPDLTIVLNGGLSTIPAMQQALEQLDGVMLGRVAWHEPYILSLAEQALCDDTFELPVRTDLLRSLYPYVQRRLATGENLSHSIRPMLGLLQGLPGARKFRRVLSEGAHRPGADESLIEAALTAATDAARLETQT